MQKKLIVAAVAAAAAAPAIAQNSVTIYGVLDMGYARYSDTSSGVNPGLGRINKIDQNGHTSSRLGFKGEEALGGGLKTVWVLEVGTSVDGAADAQTGGTTGFQGAWRQAYVGLGSNYGTGVLGRVYTPFHSLLTVVDPFATTGVGSATIIHPDVAQNQRFSSALRYDTPNIGGFTASFAYGAGENAADAAAKDNTWGANVVYAAGPAMVGLAYVKLNDVGGVAGADMKTTLLAGTYNFGVAKLAAGYNRFKNTTIDHGDWHLGVTVPMGPHTILAAYNRANDKTTPNEDANHWALGYDYGMSKRTVLYARYAKVNNKNGAQYALNTSGSLTNHGAVSALTDAGGREQGLALGIKHTF